MLINDTLAGRVDLKSDRQQKVLRVQAAWHEHGGRATSRDELAARLAPLLRRTAQWQGLDAIEVMDHGTLAAAVASELGVSVAPRLM